MKHVTTGDESQRASSASCAERPQLVSSRVAVATATAALVVACLFWTAGQEPLPSFGWAAAFLFLAIQQDVFRLRIPNWLTLPSLGLVLAASGIMPRYFSGSVPRLTLASHQRSRRGTKGITSTISPRIAARMRFLCVGIQAQASGEWKHA